MARILPLLAATLLAFTAHAAIHRVNNTGIAADFTTLQDAHDAASAGDTLHVEPSGTSYGNCTFTKQLVAIGPGWFLNLNAQLQANIETAKTGSLTFEAGSEGSVVSGLVLPAGSTLSVRASFVRVERCHLSGPLHIAYSGGPVSITGVVVNGCHVTGQAFLVGGSTHVVNDLTMSNNRFSYVSFGSGPANGELLNNVVINGSTAYIGAAGISASNNIFDCPVSPGGTAFAHNLFRNAEVPATNGNLVNVPMAGVFVGGTGDAQYLLAPGSPAIGAGVGGIDCGLFAGLEPYKLSGIPPVPGIFNLGAATSTDQGTPLQVTIGARSND